MTKILQLLGKLEKLEQEIAQEEKDVLKLATSELKAKLDAKDIATIEIQKKIIAKQENDFNSFNLKRVDAIEKLDTTLEKLLGKKFSISDSEHWLLFSAISICENVPSKILEIGTADGITAAILASLFPKSEIVTIDLPQENEKFRLSYNRSDSFAQYAEKRDSLIATFNNITFVAMNSINLNVWSEKSFDLIWVDGAHGYPILPLDLHNACRLIKKNGFVIVDDVFTNVRKTDEMYRSTAAIQTLKLFQENNIISKYKLLRKRLALKYNFKELNEKFLGVVQF